MKIVFFKNPMNMAAICISFILCMNCVFSCVMLLCVVVYSSGGTDCCTLICVLCAVLWCTLLYPAVCTL